MCVQNYYSKTKNCSTHISCCHKKNQCKIVCVFLYNKVDVQNELLVVWWNYLRVVWWCSEALLALCTES